MYVVVIAWIYVVLMAAVAEAVSTTGTVLGAVITFLLWGVLPLSIVVYIIGTPGRKRALQARAMAERAEADQVRAAAGAASTAEVASVAPDADGKPPAAAQLDAVAPVRKEA